MIDLKYLTNKAEQSKNDQTHVDDHKHSTQLDKTTEHFKIEQLASLKDKTSLSGFQIAKNDDSCQNSENKLDNEKMDEINLNDLVIGLYSEIEGSNKKRNFSSKSNSERAGGKTYLSMPKEDKSQHYETEAKALKRINLLYGSKSCPKDYSEATDHNASKQDDIPSASTTNLKSNHNSGLNKLAKPQGLYELISLNSYFSHLTKFRFQLQIEAEFEENFRIESSILFKEGFGFKKYKIVLKSNKLLLINPSNKFKSSNESSQIMIEKNPWIILDFDFMSVSCYTNALKQQFELVAPTGTKFLFQVEGKDKTLYDRLIIYLNHIIQASKGFRDLLTSICFQSNFFKSYYMSELDFVHSARTGDILLFRGFEFPAKCQRMLTCEEYGINCN